MRLFVSIALTEKLREQIVKCREEIMRSCFTEEQKWRMRWINDKEYHVTQYFIGEVSLEKLEELTAIIERVTSSTRSFTLTSGAFEFKPKQNPRMIWLRFEVNDAFTELTHRLHNALVAAHITNNDIPAEPIPHVTLIRLKHVKPINFKLPQLPTQRIQVVRIDLMQSTLKPTGSEYTIVQSFDLT